jgi:hypothetical protein
LFSSGSTPSPEGGSGGKIGTALMKNLEKEDDEYCVPCDELLGGGVVRVTPGITGGDSHASTIGIIFYYR